MRAFLFLVLAAGAGGCGAIASSSTATETAAPIRDTGPPADTAAPPCEHPLSEYGNPGGYETLDQAIETCTERPSDPPEPEPCGSGAVLLCIGGGESYWSLSLYFDAAKALVGVERVTDVTEYCGGTSFSEWWGDVSCDD